MSKLSSLTSPSDFIRYAFGTTLIIDVRAFDAAIRVSQLADLK